MRVRVQLSKVCASIEFATLARLHEGGVPCPRPLFTSGNIVVMGAVGTDKKLAPSLADCHFSSDELATVYVHTMSALHKAWLAGVVSTTASEHDFL